MVALSVCRTGPDKLLLNCSADESALSVAACSTDEHTLPLLLTAPGRAAACTAAGAKLLTAVSGAGLPAGDEALTSCCSPTPGLPAVQGLGKLLALPLLLRLPSAAAGPLASRCCCCGLLQPLLLDRGAVLRGDVTGPVSAAAAAAAAWLPASGGELLLLPLLPGDNGSRRGGGSTTALADAAAIAAAGHAGTVAGPAVAVAAAAGGAGSARPSKL